MSETLSPETPSTETQGHNTVASPDIPDPIRSEQNPATSGNVSNADGGAAVSDTSTQTSTTGDGNDGVGSDTGNTSGSDGARLAREATENVAQQLHELEERLGLKLSESEGRITSATTAGTSSVNDIQLLTTEQVVAYVPTDAPQFVASYMTPVLWGIAAGIVAFLIGFVWDAFKRLLGLAAHK